MMKDQLFIFLVLNLNLFFLGPWINILQRFQNSFPHTLLLGYSFGGSGLEADKD